MYAEQNGAKYGYTKHYHNIYNNNKLLDFSFTKKLQVFCIDLSLIVQLNRECLNQIIYYSRNIEPIISQMSIVAAGR